MRISNVDAIPGTRIVEHYGMVQGGTIRTKHIGRDFAAAMKNLVGGELKGYHELLDEASREALERAIEQAEEMGANAIVNVRFSTSSVMTGAAEVVCYGTAVRIES